MMWFWIGFISGLTLCLLLCRMAVQRWLKETGLAIDRSKRDSSAGQV